MSNRVGFGYDVHAFCEDRPLVLGGVEIPFEKGLAGHSDADVLLHSITDALLGAAALGDIGSHFPDTDSKWKGADSRLLLRMVAERVREAGFEIENVDVTIALQQPKLRPYIDRMREVTAEMLAISLDRVSIKATTTERLGFEGREEGISAYAVCLLEG